MSTDRGGGRTLDLTVAPARSRSGLLVWLVVVLLAAGSLYAFFFHGNDSGDTTRPALHLADGRLEELALGGMRLSIRLGPDWKRVPTDGIVRFELPLDEGSVQLSISLAEGADANACMSAFVAAEAIRPKLASQVLFERFRWLDEEDGLGAWEAVLGDSDPKRPTIVEPRHHRIWVGIRDRVVLLAYDVPPGSPENALDRVEQVIATLSSP